MKQKFEKMYTIKSIKLLDLIGRMGFELSIFS